MSPRKIIGWIIIALAAIMIAISALAPETADQIRAGVVAGGIDNPVEIEIARRRLPVRSR